MSLPITKTMKLRKDGKQDRRYKDYVRTLWGWEWKHYRAAILWGLLLGTLGTLILVRTLRDEQNTSPKPAGQTMVQEVKADEPTDEYYHQEPIRYIRHRGEELGYKNQDITKAIRIARCESNFNQYAKNPNSTAKGIYQFIDGTWRANCLKDGNVYNFVDNINCFWKVYAKQNDRPWVSSIKCWR
jgi:hypothetical protein